MSKKPKTVPLELLESKQKEAAWHIERTAMASNQKTLELQLQEARDLVEQLRSQLRQHQQNATLRDIEFQHKLEQQDLHSQSQLAEAYTSLTSTQTKLFRSEQQVNELQDDRADLTSQLNQASSRCDELAGVVSRLESDLDMAGQQKAALTEELAQSKSQHEQDVRDAAARLEETISEHRSVVAGLKDELATLAAETEKKRVELEDQLATSRLRTRAEQGRRFACWRVSVLI
ncbi:hypothetical protein PINS_up022820 [Pythium insidiosum]|nr:hypothetical protein PINS_up022820 [Pythium insidiosum]